MKTTELKVARIGNSRGVRLPAEVLRRYAIGDSVVMEERDEGLLLRPNAVGTQKLSWEATAREMAGAGEDWSAWDVATDDGLSDVPWEEGVTPRVAEKKGRYGVAPRGGRQA